MKNREGLAQRYVSFGLRQLAVGLLGGAVLGAGLTSLPSVVHAQPAGARPGPFQTEGPDRQLDAGTRRQVIDKLLGYLRNDYAVPAIGEKMARAIDAARKKGAYDTVSSATALAERLTTDLRAVSRDLHLAVVYKGNGFPGLRAQAQPPAGNPPAVPAGRRNPAKSNFEYHEARWMPGNVGYLKISSFGAPDAMAAEVRNAAMAFLHNTDALIIDLRGNNGGGPQPSLTGYFFDEAKLLGKTYHREGNRIEENWTVPAGQAAYGETKPLYILVDKVTFSAAESFSYNLQAFGRAKVVGEKTNGGARPATMRPINDNFAVILPFAYSKNSVTQTDWEGTGIKPDIEVAADKALDVAYQAALKHVQSTTGRP